MITISHTHAALQICIVGQKHIAITCNNIVGDSNYLWSENMESTAVST